MSLEYDFLNKDVVKTRLIDASLYLMAFHLLKSSIVDGVRDFFVDGFKDGKETISAEYEVSVLTRSKYRFEASLIFLVENGAIDELEVTEIQGLRDYRNQLAHDVPSSIYKTDELVDIKKIERAGYFLNKIDNFWGKIEADINPDFAPDDIDYDGIKSVRSMVFDHIAAIVREDSEGI